MDQAVATPKISNCTVTIRASWLEQNTRVGGSETVKAKLSQPWWEFLSLDEQQRVDTLGMFSVEGSKLSSLKSKRAFESEWHAKDAALKSAMRFVFIDVMRVLPSTKATVMAGLGLPFDEPDGTWGDPAAEHKSFWFDPQTGAHLAVNEPYPDKLYRNEDAQQAWLQEHGLIAIELPKFGMHVPGRTITQIITKNDANAVQSLESRSTELVARMRRVRRCDW